MSEQNLIDAPSHGGADDFDGGYDAGDFEGSAAGGPAAPGMGQSKSSRRRRRKRKNKGAEGASAGSEGATGAGSSDSPAASPIVMPGESLALAAAASPQTQQQPRRQGGGSQQQGGGQNQGGQNQGGQGQREGKRWKKKFRDRERRPRNENPGNDFRSENNNGGGSRENSGFAGNGGGYANHGGGSYGGGGGYRERGDYRPDNFGNLSGGFKRKGKGGGGSGGNGGSRERSFIGPMDHSYREFNLDYHEAPPATIQVHTQPRRHGRQHQGDNQPIDHNMPRPIPIPENAQTHIYLFIDDLFVTAKVQETARKLGVKVGFVKADKDVVAELTEAEENKPALIVFDLNNANAKPLTMIPKLKAKLKRSVSIIGFLSHLQGDLKAKAIEVGCDVVMARAAFSQNLPNLLRRYGVEEGDDPNFNR